MRIGAVGQRVDLATKDGVGERVVCGGAVLAVAGLLAGSFRDVQSRGSKFAPLTRALRDWRENVQRALTFMERRGLVRRLGSGPLLGDGWVVADGASDPAKGAE